VVRDIRQLSLEKRAYEISLATELTPRLDSGMGGVARAVQKSRALGARDGCPLPCPLAMTARGSDEATKRTTGGKPLRSTAAGERRAPGTPKFGVRVARRTAWRTAASARGDASGVLPMARG
jgi:hypothetical protein